MSLGILILDALREAGPAGLSTEGLVDIAYAGTTKPLRADAAVRSRIYRLNAVLRPSDEAIATVGVRKSMRWVLGPVNRRTSVRAPAPTTDRIASRFYPGARPVAGRAHLR